MSEVVVLVFSLFLGIGPFAPKDKHDPITVEVFARTMVMAVVDAEAVLTLEEKAALLFEELELGGMVNPAAFVAGYSSMVKHRKASKNVLAIADMTLPSTEKRLYLIDLNTKRLLISTWVSHGENSGELYAKEFSNAEGSHQSSQGMFEVGDRITSPKHGPALLLHGLDAGLNDLAERREIIMHKADYVSSDFIRENGHLGRSWGCPAVSEEAMPFMLEHLTNKGLLYVHA